MDDFYFVYFKLFLINQFNGLDIDIMYMIKKLIGPVVISPVDCKSIYFNHFIHYDYMQIMVYLIMLMYL